MKKLTLIILISMMFSSVYSIEYFGYRYNFPYFRYIANQSFGGSVSVYGNGDLDRMFEISAELNAYINAKVEQNLLKDKPIVYDICGFEYKRNRSLLEIYEGENAYHISVNTGSCNNFYYFLTRKELFHVVDYIASPDFRPLYINDKPKGRFNLEGVDSSDHPPTAAYEVYSLDDIKIEYIEDEFKLTNKDKGGGINLTLNIPFVKPIKFNSRILIIDRRFLYVVEKGIVTKKEEMLGILDGEGLEYNYIQYKTYSDRVDFYSSIDEKILFRYHYGKNELESFNY